MRAFFRAPDVRGIVFTRNATEAINLVAYSFARPRLQAGDEVLISAMEHHSNIVPWQLACEATGARLVVAPDRRSRRARPRRIRARLLAPRTRIAAVTHMSNALGTISPRSRSSGWRTRAASRCCSTDRQAAYHLPVDLSALGCDFYAITGHKLYGPTGIGVLYGPPGAARADAARSSAAAT